MSGRDSITGNGESGLDREGLNTLLFLLLGLVGEGGADIRLSVLASDTNEAFEDS